MNFLFYIFLAYLLYRLIFHFIVPVWRTTRQVKHSFRKMQDHMNGSMNGTSQATHSSQQNREYTHPKGDYIDFEEVKD